MPRRHLTNYTAPAGRSRGWSRTVEHGRVVWRVWRQHQGKRLTWEQSAPVNSGRRAAALELRLMRESLRTEIALRTILSMR